MFFIFLIALFKLNSILIAEEQDSWAWKTLQTMSLDEKIGQLFMVAGYIEPKFAKNEIGNQDILQEIEHYITNYHIGGIGYVGRSESIKQVNLTNHYQKISKFPILIAQDLEWGLSMRLSDGMRFPKNITLGAIKDNELIYKMGKEIGVQAKLIGVHMNLSPVLDVNTEPENIVINVRSFGDNPQKVAEKGIAMIKGLQDAGIIASAKHFPGIGDITIDPHLDLPMSSHKEERFREIEFYPFAKAIEAGVLSIQTEHLMIPSLDKDDPSSLSPKIVNDLLKKELGFKGLVISGALRMKALTNQFSDEEIALKAFLAGSDMLLMPKDFPKSYNALKTAVAMGKITEKEIDERVLKILQLKERSKLHEKSTIEIPRLEQLHSPNAKQLKKMLYQSAVSLIRKNPQFDPLNLKNKNSIAYIQIGESATNIFLDKLRGSLNIDRFIFSFDEDIDKLERELLQNIKEYSLIILAVYPADSRRIAEIRLMNEKKQEGELKEFCVHGIPQSFLKIRDLLKDYQEMTIVNYFGNPFGMHFFDEFTNFIMAYEDDPDAQQAAVDILFNGSF